MTSPKVEQLRLPDIKGWTRNPKQHDLKRLEESLERFGFVAPLIMDATTGRLVAGHGRLEALTQRRERNLPPPIRIEKDTDGEWLVPVLKIPFKDEKQAEAYLLADNRLVEAGGWDESMLLSMLQDITAEGSLDGLTGLGWESADLDALSAFTALSEGPAPGAGPDEPNPTTFAPPETRARVIIVCKSWAQAKQIVEALGGTWVEKQVTYDAKDFVTLDEPTDATARDADG